jgi:hypothetical protein
MEPEPPASEMEQVDELLDVIQALKLMGSLVLQLCTHFLSAGFSLYKKGVNLGFTSSDLKIPPGCL